MKEDDTGNALACAFSRDSSGIGYRDDPEGGVEIPEIVSN
jgi:hypothetical protein